MSGKADAKQVADQSNLRQRLNVVISFPPTMLGTNREMIPLAPELRIVELKQRITGPNNCRYGTSSTCGIRQAL